MRWKKKGGERESSLQKEQMKLPIAQEIRDAGVIVNNRISENATKLSIPVCLRRMNVPNLGFQVVRYLTCNGVVKGDPNRYQDGFKQ